MNRAVAGVGVGGDVPCEATVGLKRLMWGIDGKQPTCCLNHAPLEGGLVVHAAVAEMASSMRGSGFLILRWVKDAPLRRQHRWRRWRRRHDR